MSEQPAETGAAPAPSNTYADPNAPVPAPPDDANAASDTITVDKGEGTTVTGEVHVEQDPTVPPSGPGEPEPDPADDGESKPVETTGEPDPRTLDADGNVVPDFFAPPETPPAHDPQVHGMATRAIQAAGTGALVKFEHVIMGVARFAHNHPELDRVFVQGLIDALSAVEKA